MTAIVKEMITRQEAAAKLGISMVYLDRLRMAGMFCAETRVGLRAVRFRLDDVEAWREAHRESYPVAPNPVPRSKAPALVPA